MSNAGSSSTTTLPTPPPTAGSNSNTNTYHLPLSRAYPNDLYHSTESKSDAPPNHYNAMPVNRKLTGTDQVNSDTQWPAPIYYVKHGRDKSSHVYRDYDHPHPYPYPYHYHSPQVPDTFRPGLIATRINRDRANNYEDVGPSGSGSIPLYPTTDNGHEGYNHNVSNNYAYRTRGYSEQRKRHRDRCANRDDERDDDGHSRRPSDPHDDLLCLKLVVNGVLACLAYSCVALCAAAGSSSCWFSRQRSISLLSAQMD
ncbi:hypothetical protein CPB84DRAFT_1852150 [Gymnopilus junonius]|uniref:Uncharacterized protein n=1 Tax=Gymnopilus junonius TaxID=109634 RepID=A0A9P5NDK0_GYMJU|nr:hypothetical protein CPB84DRAFT_1852150 [Gymnopilus junonius]